MNVERNIFQFSTDSGFIVGNVQLAGGIEFIELARKKSKTSEKSS